MSDHDLFQQKMLAAKELGRLVAQFSDPSAAEARSARAAYRRALEDARDAAPNDPTRESLDELLMTDPKAAE
jgi:hypothetical protein